MDKETLLKAIVYNVPEETRKKFDLDKLYSILDTIFEMNDAEFGVVSGFVLTSIESRFPGDLENIAKVVSGMGSIFKKHSQNSGKSFKEYLLKYCQEDKN